ncbi:MAG: hypothetical protein AAB793_02625 [Patescibacteria group bacterium]|mgnify:CR=1 FL=1
MRLVISDTIVENEVVLMRRLGYSPHENFEGKLSFVRRTSNLPFPRLHIYLETGPQGLFLKIHFDAKRETYEPGKVHSLEKEGEVVEEEIKRIYSILKGSYSKIYLVR